MCIADLERPRYPWQPRAGTASRQGDLQLGCRHAGCCRRHRACFLAVRPVQLRRRAFGCWRHIISELINWRFLILVLSQNTEGWLVLQSSYASYSILPVPHSLYPPRHYHPQPPYLFLFIDCSSRLIRTCNRGVPVFCCHVHGILECSRPLRMCLYR
jgi:hypothetical protein